MIRIFLNNLAAAFSLVFFRRTDESRIVVAWGQVAAFGLAGLMVPVVHDLASIGLDGQLEWYAVPSAMAHLPLILFAAIVVSYVLGQGDRALLLLQTFLMIGVAMDLIVYAIYSAVAVFNPSDRANLLSRELSLIIAPTWFALACAKASADFFSASVKRRIWSGAASIVLLAVPLILMHSERSLWRQPPANEEFAATGNHRQPTDEDVFYDQPRLLHAELGAVQPGRPGVIDVYFIGMGGYAYQDVFMREVNAVSRLFRERFHADGRIIRLVNNRETVATLPIASVTGLRASLQRVADVMDKDEDILFLFLTSHGSESHRFALDFWPLRLHELSPATLRALLDESGIRNRVVVVSACYAGGYINALKDDHTLAIAAAAPDRNSFGCSNEAEWTYFGKAYFDEALRKTYSFVEAFELALPVIAERERKQGYEPSDPQIALGESIKPTLATLEKQLARR